jgi:receptor protein-tyrosine kinase
MIRTALLERLGDQRGGTVLITSAGPRAGKTTVSSLLARSLAECGKRVLLVDADRHRSAIAEFFGLPRGPGIRLVVAGAAEDKDAIVAGPVEGLSILPAGELGETTSSDLFANGVFDTCIRRWRESYDVIVIDSPPLLPVADARILARHAHGTILVMRATRCRRADVLEAFSALSIAGGRLIGTVLTGARRTQQYVDSYSRYYNYASA